MIKVISFDVGGTLIEFDKSAIDKYSLKALATLTERPYEIVRVAYKDVFQKMKGSLNELVDEFCKKIDIKKEDKIINFFEKKFSSNNDLPISEEKIEIIKKLKSLGYQVIILSNSCCLIDNKEVKKLEEYLDGIFYSYDLGYNKDEKQSYRYIEKILDRKAHEFLHIGDTLSSDYYVPIKNGWHALYYGKTTNEEVDTIQNLKEIFEVLEKGLN